jgi:hypothetical protein
MINKSKEIIECEKMMVADLYALSREYSSPQFEIFISVLGHLGLVKVAVITNCDYAEAEPKNRLLNDQLDTSSSNYVGELQRTLLSVKALIAQHNGQSQLVQNNHLVASVHSVRSHPLLGVNP